MARSLEHAVPEEWTEEAVETAGVSDLVVRSIRAGRLTPEEGLLAAIFPPDAIREAGRKHAVEELGLSVHSTRDTRPHRALSAEERAARQREREHNRYHGDPDYRERRLAQMRERRAMPGFKEREAERKRRARARKR